ncbi:MAG: hypothetical protein NVS4B3_10430 [Gemmatimonadaceae bacterium]
MAGEINQGRRLTQHLRRRVLTLVAASAVIGVSSKSARAQQLVSEAIVRDGTLSFSGHATPLGDFEGRTTTVSGRVSAQGSGVDIRGWVEASVRTLTTGNRLRDRELNQLMDSKRYPVIRFELDTWTTTQAESPERIATTLHGFLTIHGVTRPVEVPGVVTRTVDGTRFVARFPVRLTDYDIRDLTKAFGLIRLNNKVVVGVDVSFGMDRIASR